MRRLLLALTLGLGLGCRSAPPPPPPAAAPAPAPAPAVEPPVSAPDEAAVDPAARYRDVLEREVAGVRRLRRVGTFEGQIQVRTFRGRRRQDGVLYLTLRSAPSSGPELLARADRSRPEVAEVLVSIATRCDPANPCKGYSPVALESPVRGLQYFDLVPAGMARIDDQDVQLLRVLPLTSEEYEAASSDTRGAWSGAGRADQDAEGSAGARWAPVFEVDESANSTESASPPPSTTE